MMWSVLKVLVTWRVNNPRIVGQAKGHIKNLLPLASDTKCRALSENEEVEDHRRCEEGPTFIKP